jgi:hypothetical protein
VESLKNQNNKSIPSLSDSESKISSGLLEKKQIKIKPLKNFLEAAVIIYKIDCLQRSNAMLFQVIAQVQSKLKFIENLRREGSS